MVSENKKYKDSVFADLFYSDKNAAKNLLDLYNALYGTSYTDPETVEKIRLEDVIFMNFKNDVAALMNRKRLFLSEHQSTINENMPLRMLVYVAREYEKIVPSRMKFHEKCIKIPTPGFVTFYNGAKPMEKERVLKLSDAYMDFDGNKPELELTVRVININTDAGHDILKNCKVLRDYSAFVDETRFFRKNGGSLGDAVKSCVKQGILSEYLTRKGSEVINMLTAEYNYEEDIAAKQEEARADALAEAEAKANADAFKKDQAQVRRMDERGFSDDVIIDILQIDKARLAELRA